MDKRVKQFLECAVAYAKGGEAPPRDLIGVVSELDTPLLPKPSDAREYLWRILSYPERARALAVLNAVDLLTEFIPLWTAYTNVQDLRIAAVDQVHIERWADGLGEWAFGRICRFHDAGVDQRLNGWALTGLATALAHDTEMIAGYVSSVRLDLTALDATENEIERVVSIITEFPIVHKALLTGQHRNFGVSAGTIVAVLSTMLVEDGITKEQIEAAIRAADRWLS